MSKTVWKFPLRSYFHLKVVLSREGPYGASTPPGKCLLPSISVFRAGAAGNKVSPLATPCSSAEKQHVARWNQALAREPRVGKVRCRGRVLRSWEIHLGDGDQRWSDLRPKVAVALKPVWWTRSALCWSKFATWSPAREFDMRLFKKWM